VRLSLTNRMRNVEVLQLLKEGRSCYMWKTKEGLLDRLHLARKSRLKEMCKERKDREQIIICYWICFKDREGVGN